MAAEEHYVEEERVTGRGRKRLWREGGSGLTRPDFYSNLTHFDNRFKRKRI